ncbi:hypothetical protein [Mesorhizobium sp. KR2-14]|uniref:hypothetical protein n=1 Tax=Mesorhizobium sp. KR2-14 TaxID=3156610 RepID=UPI0032B4090D
MELFKAPFDPYVEMISHGDLFVLKANSLSGVTEPREMYDAAKLLVRQMNSIVIAMIGESEVVVNGTCEDRDGRLHRTVHLEPESIHFQFGMGSPELCIYDSLGRLIEPPPSPTRAQQRMTVALAHESISQALLYCGSNPDWFELYKAFECLRDADLLGSAPTKNFTQTANAMFRHRAGKHEMAKKPMTLEEARSLVRRWIFEAADKLAKSGA